MKKCIRGLIFIILAAATYVPAVAQEREQGRERLAELNKGSVQAAELEAFRREFAGFYSELMAFSRGLMTEIPEPSLSAVARDEISRQLSEGLRLIDAMTPDELAALRRAYSHYPDWRHWVRRMDSAFTPEVRRRLGVIKARFDARAIAPNAPAIDANCDPGPGFPGDIGGVTIAIQVAATAEGVMQLIPEDAFTAIPYVIAATAWGVLNIAAITIQGVYDIGRECLDAKFEDSVTKGIDSLKEEIAKVQAAAGKLQQSADGLTAGLTRVENQANFIAGQTDVKTSTRATQTSVNTLQATANIINAKLDTLADVIDEFRAENLRLQIELNLLQGPRYNLTQFQMPASAGGHLELVREIVDDTIKKAVQAGTTAISASTISQAQQAFSLGDNYLTAKSYKDAYAAYRTAYLLVAVNPAMKQP